MECVETGNGGLALTFVRVVKQQQALDNEYMK